MSVVSKFYDYEWNNNLSRYDKNFFYSGGVRWFSHAMHCTWILHDLWQKKEVFVGVHQTMILTFWNRKCCFTVEHEKEHGVTVEEESSITPWKITRDKIKFLDKTATPFKFYLCFDASINSHVLLLKGEYRDYKTLYLD